MDLASEVLDLRHLVDQGSVEARLALRITISRILRRTFPVMILVETIEVGGVVDALDRKVDRLMGTSVILELFVLRTHLVSLM